MGIRAGLVALLAVLAGGVTTAAAQVGHPPGRSPYHDISKGHTVTPLVAAFGGSGGKFGIAPHDGTVFGFRYEIRNSQPIALGLQVGRGDLDRLIVDPFVAVANRVSGPVKQTVTFAEVDLQLNVTGGKSWHRLAPFVNAGLGLVFPTSTPADTSGFELGRRVYLAPGAGFRLFLTDRLHLRGEARVAFWKLKYPASFTREPPDDPGTPDDPHAVITDGNVSQWSTSSWLQAGLGFSFSP
jgi:hypothetical protein